ncbi:MAG: SGNH/GDSL hydrolase family protein [Ignavibacteria bacterium]|nr:SGNH/GDSL hydrolase family protein [Ignavibacteria bacterium]
MNGSLKIVAGRLAAGLMVLIALTVHGCKEDENPAAATPPPVVDTGSADLTRYVALGDNLTAGFQSNALSERDQVFSFPNLTAQQVGVPFEQPLMMNPGIGSRLKLVSLTGPVIVSEQGVNPLDPASNLNGALTRPYNNLGIPGAILFDMSDTTDFVTKSVQRANPFFAQILRSAALGRSIVAQAKALSPTFISLWIGSNDVLAYATSGGTSGTNAGLADPPRTKPTEALLFDTWYRALLDELKATGAGIVIANVPDLTSLPFFTTVPSQGLVLTRQGQVDSLNAAYAALGITFSIGQNGFVAFTGSGAPRKLTPSEFVLFTVPQDSLRLAGWGSRQPIPNQYALDTDEIATAQQAIVSFNASIDSLAANRNIGVVDIRTFLATIRQSGLYITGLGTFSTAFITGGLFSYDGVNPSSRGHAIVANELIKVINARFNASIPPVPVASVAGLPIGKGGADYPIVGSMDFTMRLLTGM